MEHLTAFLTRMPKVELHVHLESTMPGEMLARFAARQGRELPRPAERLYDCSAEDLSDFLAFLDNICSFVGTPEELAEAAEHAALESGREHILYSEMILNGDVYKRQGHGPGGGYESSPDPPAGGPLH